jgi:hypothetical protein
VKRIVALACVLVFAGCGRHCAKAVPATMPECTRTSTAAFTVLPNEEWAFLPIEKARCGRGSELGIGINKSARSKRLLFFFVGGGACFDKTSCDKSCKPNVQLCAANLDGFGPKQWAAENRSTRSTIFDREDPTNPFREDSWVFMPYCTGDFQSGNRHAEYGIDHVGWDAVDAVLEKIAPTFCDVDQIVLYGVSAGGFAVVFNYEHVRAAFPAKVKIDLVDDSGPPLSRAWMPLQEEMGRSWGSAKHAPPGCPECADDWERYLPYLSAKYPDARFSLVSYQHDEVIAHGFGGALLDPATFRRALDLYAKDVLGPLPNVRVFLAGGSGHGVVREQMFQIVAGGVTFADFLRKEVDGDPAWASAR